MATIQTEQETTDLLKQSEKAVQKKIISQEKLGKDFVLPDDGGSGVIPESVWKNLPGKKIENPEAIE